MSNPQQPPPDLKARIKTSYDAIAPTYNKWTEQHTDVRQRYLQTFLDSLPPPSPSSSAPQRILELGCGAGEPATRTLASRANTRVIANDISTGQLALARANSASWTLGTGSSVEFVQGDMAELEFEEGGLDGVVALYSFIHLPREEQSAMLGRVRGWLREGGVLMGNFSEGEMEGQVLERWLGEEDGWMFWSGWGAEGTRGVFGEVGLEVLREGLEGEGVDVKFWWVVARKGR